MAYWSVAALALFTASVTANVATVSDANLEARKQQQNKELNHLAKSTFLTSAVSESELLKLYNPTHSFYQLGNIDPTRLFKLDIDRDGTDEFIGLSSFGGDDRRALTVIGLNNDKTSYVIRRQSAEKFTSQLMAVYHVPGSAQPVALISDNYGGTQLISLENFESVLRLEYGLSFDQPFLYDIDNNGTPELVTRNYPGYRFYNAATLTEEGSASSGYYSSFPAGNFDDQADLDFIEYTQNYDYNTGQYTYTYTLKSLTLSTVTTKKSLTALPATGYYNYNSIQAYDVNGDQIDELILTTYQGVTVYDIKNDVKLWESTNSSYTFNVLGDVDDNGSRALLINTGNNNVVRLINANNGTLRRDISVPNGFSRIFKTVDNPQLVLFGSTDYYYGTSHIQRLDLKGDKVAPASDAIGSRTLFSGVARGTPTRVVSISGSSDSWSNPIRAIRVLAADDLSLIREVRIDGLNNAMFQSAVIVDANNDGVDELVLAVNNNYGYFVYVIDLNTGLDRHYTLTNQYTGIQLQKVQVNNKTLVAIGNAQRMGLFDPASGVVSDEVINSEQIYGYEPLRSVVLDLDGNGATDILFAHQNNTTLYRFELNPTPRYKGKVTAPNLYRATALTTSSGGAQSLFVSDQQGAIWQYDATTDRWALAARLCTDQISTFAALEAATQALVICGRQAAIYDASNGTARFVQYALPTYVTAPDAVSYQVNEAGKRTLFIGGGRLLRVAYTGHIKRPIAMPMMISTHWRTPISEQLLVNNPNSDMSLTAAVTVQPLDGELVFDANNALQFNYTPKSNKLDADEFRYTVSNGYLESEPASVKIERTNHAPMVFAATADVRAGSEVSGKIVINDVDGDPLTTSVSKQGSLGNLTVSNDGSFNYSANSAGTDTIEITVSDGVSATVTKVTVNVTKKKSGGGGSPALLWLVVLVLGLCVRHQQR